MIRIYALFALLLLALPVSAMAQDLFERERDVIGSTPSMGETEDCTRFSDCGMRQNRIRENAVGETHELQNGFDNDGRGSRRSISDNVLDQLSPASGR